MAKLLEVIDSINDENLDEGKETLKSEFEALDKSNKQLYARAKKAEGFEQKDGKWVKKPEVIPEVKPTNPEATEPDKPDYGKLAYLKSEGVSHPDDRKIVMDESKRLNLPIEEVLGMEHIKGKLKDSKNQREAESGMPEGGSGKSSGNKSVDYYVNKKDKNGNYESVPPELGVEFANKVIDARVKQEKVGNMFSEELHN